MVVDGSMEPERPREWLAAGTAAVSWSFVDRAASPRRVPGSAGLPEDSAAGVRAGHGDAGAVAGALGDPWRVFLELGPGVSWSDTTVPPRGTRFNYLIVGGGGFLRRIGSQVHAVAGARWWHLSNNSREGRSRNPDIEGLGGYAGVAIAF